MSTRSYYLFDSDDLYLESSKNALKNLKEGLVLSVSLRNLSKSIRHDICEMRNVKALDIRIGSNNSSVSLGEIGSDEVSVALFKSYVETLFVLLEEYNTKNGTVPAIILEGTEDNRNLDEFYSNCLNALNLVSASSDLKPEIFICGKPEVSGDVVPNDKIDLEKSVATAKRLSAYFNYMKCIIKMGGVIEDEQSVAEDTVLVMVPEKTKRLQLLGRI